MNKNQDKSERDDNDTKPSVNGDPKQGKVDPQLSELDGLKKGGVEPVVHNSDKARDNEGRIDR